MDNPFPPRTAVDLYWLPVGAGDQCVRTCAPLYEVVVAAWQRRARCDLYHAALEVHLDGQSHVVEMAPVWDRADPDRGVVAEGPVGLPVLGRSRWFRYEVRCWRGGMIPDIAYAVDSPVRCSADRDRARRALDVLPAFPARTWARDEQHAGEMWNSNSLVAWVLAASGHDLTAVHPPTGGRAPGWGAGLEVARRQSGHAPAPA